MFFHRVSIPGKFLFPASLLNITSGKFFKHLTSLLSGTVIAQILGLAITPFLTRLYEPSDFGLLGGVLTLTAIISSAATFKYETAIILGENKNEVRRLVLLSLILLLSVTGILGLLLSIRSDFLPYLGVNSKDGILVLIVCLLTFLMGAYNILVQCHSKNENYSRIAKNRILQKITLLSIQLLWVYFLTTKFGLIIGTLCGFLISVLFLTKPLIQTFAVELPTANEIKLIAKKYYRFALYSTPQNLLNSISQGLPILLLGRYFSSEQVGYYFFAMGILQLPASIIGGSIRQIFYKRASDFRKNKAKLKKEYLKLTFGLLGLITIPIIVIFLYGPEIFSFIFGKEWHTSGLYAGYMFLWVGIMFINPPSSAMFNILNLQKQQLLFEILLFISRLSALLLVSSYGSMLLTVQVYSVVGLVFNCLFIGYILYKILKWK